MVEDTDASPPETATAPLDPLPPPMEEDDTTHLRILEKLTASDLIMERDFRLIEHEPVRTSEQAAAVRNVPLATGAKAMLYRDTKTEKIFLLVVSAATRIDNKKFKQQFGKNTRTVSDGDVVGITGCVPGAVPPFGSLFKRGDVGVLEGEEGIPVYVDESMLTQDIMCFNAGLRGKSVVGLKVEAWKSCENAEVVSVGVETVD